MYNESLKRAFIVDEVTSVKTGAQIEQLFALTEPFELEAGADICTFSREDIQPVINSLSGARSISDSYVHGLRKYCKWCVSQGVQGATDVSKKVRPDKSEKVRAKMAANPKDLKEYLDDVFDAEENNGTDNIFRAYFWLAYGGMKRDDIMSIPASGVLLDDNRLVYGDYTMEIYPEARRTFVNCVKLDEFTKTRVINPKVVVQHQLQRENNGLLLRTTKGSSLHTIASNITHRTREAIDSGKTKRRMTYESVWLSGVFFRVFQLEIYGVEPNFDWAINEVCSNPEGVHYAKKKREITADYNLWKEVFH